MLRELDIIIKAKEMVSKELTGIRRHLGVFYTTTVKQFQGIRRAAMTARSALLAIGLAVGARAMFKSFVSAATDFDKWKEAVGRAGEAWKGFQREIMDAGVMDYLITALEGVTGKLKDMEGKGKDIAPVIIDAFDSIGRAVGYVATGFEVFKAGLLAIGAVGAKVGQKLTEGFTAIFESITEDFDNMKDNPFWKWIIGEENMKGAYEWSKGAVKGLDAVSDKLESISGQWTEDLANLTDPGRMKPHEQMNAWLDNIKSKAEAAGKALKAVGGNKIIFAPCIEMITEGRDLFVDMERVILKSAEAADKFNEKAAGKNVRAKWDAFALGVKRAADTVGKASRAIADKWTAIRDIITDVADRVLQGLADAMIEYAEGGLRTVEERWRAVANIMKDVSAMFLRIAVQAASSAIGAAIIPAAKGGIFNTGGSQPIRAMAGGGITRGPELVLRGEGRRPEAVVPLPDGRSIPVKQVGGSAPQIVNNWNVYAWDSQSLRQFAHKNRSVFAAATGQAVRENPRGY